MSWFMDDHIDSSYHEQGDDNIQRRSSDERQIDLEEVLTNISKRSLLFGPVDTLTALAEAWSRGLRFTDLNNDPGKYSAAEVQGPLHYQAASECFGRAGNANKEQKYKEAVKLCTEGLKNAIKVKDNGDQLSILLCERSMAYCYLKQYDKAIKDGITSIKCAPIYLQGPERVIEALEKSEKFSDAHILCMIVMDTFNTSNDNYIRFLKLAIRLASKVPDGFEFLAERVAKYDTEVWNKVLEDLADDGNWGSVHILLMGTDDVPPILTSYDASKLMLAQLVEFCGEAKWKQWGQKLVLILLKKGAKYNTLCAKKKFPFHVALRLGLKTGTFDLLKRLFLDYSSSKDHKMRDNDGNTLLHIACRDNGSHRSTAIKLLLNHEIDPNVKNKAGKLAMDSLSPESPDYTTISQSMKKDSSQSTIPGGPVMSTILGGPGTPLPIPGEYHRGSAGIPTLPALPGGSIANLLAQYPNPFDNAIAPVTPVTAPASEQIRSWSKTKIQKWLEDKELSQHKKKFKDIDGNLLAELKIMQNTAPEMFYKILEESLQLPLVDILKCSSSVRELPF